MSRYLMAKAIYVLTEDPKVTHIFPTISKGSVLVNGMDNEWYYPSTVYTAIFNEAANSNPDCWPNPLVDGTGIPLFRDYWHILEGSNNAPVFKQLMNVPWTLVKSLVNYKH